MSNAFPVRSKVREAEILAGRFATAADGTVSAVSDGRGFTAARQTDPGVYRVTLADSAAGFMGASAQVIPGTGQSNLRARVSSFDAANRRFDIQVLDGNDYIHEVVKAADGAAGTTTAETLVGLNPLIGRVTAARILPAANVTADATNNATVTLSKRDAAGGTKTTVATLITNVAGGNWTAWVPKDMALSGTSANLDVVAGSVLTFEVAKGGTGVQLPALILAVDVDYSTPTNLVSGTIHFMISFRKSDL